MFVRKYAKFYLVILRLYDRYQVDSSIKITDANPLPVALVSGHDEVRLPRHPDEDVVRPGVRILFVVRVHEDDAVGAGREAGHVRGGGAGKGVGQPFVALCFLVPQQALWGRF